MVLRALISAFYCLAFYNIGLENNMLLLVVKYWVQTNVNPYIFHKILSFRPTSLHYKGQYHILFAT